MILIVLLSAGIVDGTAQYSARERDREREKQNRGRGERKRGEREERLFIFRTRQATVVKIAACCFDYREIPKETCLERERTCAELFISSFFRRFQYIGLVDVSSLRRAGARARRYRPRPRL